jgi:hypothetical protein
MAINVPMPQLPLSGLNQAISTGGNLFSQMMNPVMQRENMMRQWKQHLENMALQKQQMAHAARNDDLQRKILMERYTGLKNSNDPNYEFNKFKSTLSGLNDTDMEALKKNPALRGFFKHQFGFDPLGGENNILHGPARDASDLEKLRKEVGDESQVYQNAKSLYDAQLDAKKDLRDLRARTKQGLKPGEKEFFDPKTGTPLGKEIPLTASERQSEEGNILFNELYPKVYKGAYPFSGEGSIDRMEKAAANYKTDPKARKLFDDLMLADKVLGATVVNEAATLKSGKTNQTYKMLKETLNSQDVPKLIKKLIKQYQIPASAELRAAMRYQKSLSDARQKARKGTPATQKLFYNPEMQEQNQGVIESSTPTQESKTVIVIDPNGKKFETPESNAVNLPKGWRRG